MISLKPSFYNLENKLYIQKCPHAEGWLHSALQVLFCPFLSCSLYMRAFVCLFPCLPHAKNSGDNLWHLCGKLVKKCFPCLSDGFVFECSSWQQFSSIVCWSQRAGSQRTACISVEKKNNPSVCITKVTSIQDPLCVCVWISRQCTSWSSEFQSGLSPWIQLKLRGCGVAE